MRGKVQPCRLGKCAGLFIFLLSAAAAASHAQNPPARLVTRAIDETITIPLRGTVHPLAEPQFDRGAVADSFAANRMLLLLNRPAEREAALQSFLGRVHTPGSPDYHQWVTPEQFGERFGPADADIEAASGWLRSHGFNVARITKGKTLIEFSGTAAQLREAFHSELHQFAIAGQNHYANASELAIPEALASLVHGVAPINNFRATLASHVIGRASFSRDTGKLTPELTLPNGTTNFYAVAPEDFATEYDLGPLYAAGVNGSGQTIGIIISSNINLTLVGAYRELFGLAANSPQIVIDGDDPGDVPGADTEAYLDSELSGAVAPNATVNVYISDGSDVQDPLTLAAIRAVEDNQASVLSASFGSCERNLGPGGNYLWSQLWEQAAAQGQTVLVASGDSGSAGCDYFSYESAANQGLAVSGVASTPWNVAMGGTDFYYSDYATGAASAAKLWNSTNDSNLGSMESRVPEQVWNEPLGFDVFPRSNSIVAGSGGASGCSQVLNSVCQGGYAKPVWQNAPGVPGDGVRDLPDVSLYSGIGSNMSGYAICALPQDCAQSSQTSLFLVGGTSAAAPGMAGILALVNQKYGRQGQANHTLYALARQQPSVFHDITIGSNNVPCVQGTPNCSLDSNGDGYYTLQEYPATIGYDLASGLGSVDANALVNAWNQVTLTPTTTTLTLSSSSFAHGTVVTVTAAVQSSPGSGTPTGDVGLAITDPLPWQTNPAIALSNGTASAGISSFPGGTYKVAAQYGGDGFFGPSSSVPITITVTPQASNILFIAEGPTAPGFFVNQGAQGVYGGRWVLSAEPYGTTSNGLQLNDTTTGSVTFSDSAGSATQQIELNSQGTAGFSPNLTAGTHAITLGYSGDASFEPSTAGPFTFTIAKGTPPITFPTIQTSVPLGGSLAFDFTLGNFVSATPTGSFNLSLGSTTYQIPLSPAVAFGPLTPDAVFPNLSTAGSFPLSVSYSGDSNWNPTTATYPTNIIVAASALQPSTTTLLVNAGNIGPTDTLVMTVKVSGPAGSTVAPTGTVIFYLSGVGVSVTLSPVSNGLSMATLGGVTGAELAAGLNAIVASYGGDANYQPSVSPSGDVDVNLSNFSLTLAAPRVVISSGKSGKVPFNVTGLQGIVASIALSCTTSSSSMGCNVSPSATTYSATAAGMLTVNAFSPGQISAVSPASSASRCWSWLVIGGALVLFVLYLSPRERGWLAPRRLATLALLATATGCGGGGVGDGGGNGGGGGGGGGGAVSTPPGTYSVIVTGSANGTIVHNVKLTVIVQ